MSVIQLVIRYGVVYNGYNNLIRRLKCRKKKESVYRSSPFPKIVQCGVVCAALIFAGCLRADAGRPERRQVTQP